MTIVWNTGVWAQQRSILTVSGFASGMTNVRLEVTGYSALTARYVIPTSGTLQIDLSELVRMYNSGTFRVTENNGTTDGQSLSRTWSRSGLISPLSVLVPETDVTNEGMLISPPSRFLFNGIAAPVICEVFFSSGSSSDWELSSGTFVGNQIYVGNSFTVKKNNALKVCNMEQPCNLSCTVEWVSFTGRTRRHVFEVTKQTSEAVDAVELETLNNEYDERKGRRDGFTLRLDGLNRYDLWYYADILTSSSVRVTFDGSTWRQIQVTRKNYELPTTDEGELSTLEIPVNYRHYDTL